MVTSGHFVPGHVYNLADFFRDANSRDLCGGPLDHKRHSAYIRVRRVTSFSRGCPHHGPHPRLRANDKIVSRLTVTGEIIHGDFVGRGH